jgi:hypothetical protein
MTTVHFVGEYTAHECSDRDRMAMLAMFYEHTHKKLSAHGLVCKFLLGRAGQVKFDEKYASESIRPSDVLIVMNPPHGRGQTVSRFVKSVSLIIRNIGARRVVLFDQNGLDIFSTYLRLGAKVAQYEYVGNVDSDGKPLTCEVNVTGPCDALELADLAIDIVKMTPQ